MQTLFHIIAPALTLHSFSTTLTEEQYSSVALGTCIPDALRFLFSEYEPTKFDARKFLHYSVESDKEEFYVQYPMQKDLKSIETIKDLNGFSHNIFSPNYLQEDKKFDLVDGMTFLENFYKHNTHLPNDLYKQSIKLHLVYDFICVKLFRDYVFTKDGNVFYSNFNDKAISFDDYNKCVGLITDYIQRLYINSINKEFCKQYSTTDIEKFYYKYLYSSLSTKLNLKVFLNTSFKFSFSKNKWTLTPDNHKKFKQSLFNLGLFSENHHFEELCEFCNYIVADFFLETIKFCEKNT